MLFYPFVSYILFRYAYNIDPWCINDDCQLSLHWTGHSLAVFLVQIFATFLGYWLAWVACTMTFNTCGMVWPLLLSTPVAVIWYYLIYTEQLFPFNTPNNYMYFKEFPIALTFAIPLWLGEFLTISCLWTRSNVLLAKDEDMFLTPYYDGVFFGQQMMLNVTDKKKDEQNLRFKGGQYQSKSRQYQSIDIPYHDRAIFICSTMCHESENEMNELLTSIFSITLNNTRTNVTNTKHIFSLMMQ